jgi:solute carrier family 39 (zinc transporter), member 1/2/3
MDLSNQYTLKFVALVLIFVVGVAGGLGALGAHRSERREALFSLGSALAAGIFLGAGLIHLLPDGIEALTSYFGVLNFPLGFLIAALGFLLVVYVEMVYLAGKHGPDDDAGPAVTAYALIVILSIHSVLAGAALGTEDTLVGSLVIFLAIIAHKGAAAFALGVEFQRSGFDRSKYMRLIILFASMTPLGIVLGAGLDHLLQDRYGRLFEGIFDSLAAGTFLYIAIIEIIGREFSAKSQMGLKFVMLCTGIGLMAVIALWA